MPVTATTTLPDADQPVLGNGVEDEIAVDRQTDPTNYGDVRWQVRETGESSWSGSAVGFDQGTVAFSTTTFDITGREDGEEYEVRLRTETEHRTGAYTSPVSIITLFPAATGLAASNVSQTSLDLSWSDNSDNEDGFDVERRKQFAGGFGPWRTVASLAPNTTAYTDSAVQPGRTYQFRIEGFTDDTSATSGTIQQTTTSANARQRDIPPEGWFVEIEHPDRNTPRTLQPRESAEFRPTLNGLPECLIPVREADHWTDSGKWERQPMRVWLDGRRLPISQLAAIRTAPGGVELIGRGGYRKVTNGADDLRQLFSKDYSDTSVHQVIRDILDDVGIAKTVDNPPAATNQLIATLDTTTEFEDFAAGQTPDDPIIINSGTVEPAKTCYLVPPQDIGSVTSDATNNWTASEAYEINVTASSTTSGSVTVTTDYDIPAGEWDVALRDGDNFTGTVELFVDGTRIGAAVRSSATGKSGSDDVSWRKYTNTSFDLSAGSHTISFVDSDGGDQSAGTGTYWVDCLAIYDNTYWNASNFVNTLGGGGLLSGGPPGLYAPTNADFQIDPILRAEGGRLEATLSATTNGQALAIAPDTADDPSSLSFTTSANTTSFETDFTDSFATWTGRVTLDGVNATTQNTAVETSITTYRTEPQTLQDLTLKYDSLNTPSVRRPIEGRAIDLINELADRADLLWELQYDPSIDDLRVVATLPGQRTSDSDPDIATYEVEKDVAAEIHQAVVRGRTQRVTAESFTSDINGTSLNNDRIKKDSERVYDPSTGTEFTRGPNADYEMAYLLGTITQVAGSSMTDGDTYEISYDEKARGEDFQPNTDFENAVYEQITAFTTDAECQEAAAFIVQQSNSPLWTAEVTIPRAEAGFDLINEIDPSRLPSPPNGGYRLQRIEETPRELRLTLGSRPSIQETVQRIRSSVQRTARDV